MKFLASELSESDRTIALSRFKIIQPFLEEGWLMDTSGGKVELALKSRQ